MHVLSEQGDRIAGAHVHGRRPPVGAARQLGDRTGGHPGQQRGSSVRPCSLLALLVALAGCGTSPAGPMAEPDARAADAPPAAVDSSSDAPTDGPSTGADAAAAHDAEAQPDGTVGDESTPSGTDAKDDAVEAAVVKACTQWSEVQCALTAKCLDWYYVGADPTTCPAQALQWCLSSFDFPGVSFTTAFLAACTAGMQSVTCNEYLYAGAKSCAPPKGALADGSACVRHDQCQSLYCTTKKSTFTPLKCGTCAPQAALGASCASNAQCASGLTCSFNVCAMPVAMGAPCGATATCPPTGFCAADGTCKPFAGLGEACSSSSCSLLQGLHCGNSTKTCVALHVATAGSPCGAIGPTADDFTICAAGSDCVASGSGAGKTCKPFGQLGSPCGGGKDVACASHLVCAAGTCAALEPSLCP